MLGIGVYRGETVSILDCYTTLNGLREYLINYGGPVWVHASKLTNIELIKKGA